MKAEHHTSAAKRRASIQGNDTMITRNEWLFVGIAFLLVLAFGDWMGVW